MRCVIYLSIILLIQIVMQTEALSKDIFVPKDFLTIQEAIDAAVDGDRILVAPGTYEEHLDFKGKAIALKGEAGAAVTVIDANQTGRGVTFQSGETRDSVLEGFTITNGDVGISNGGGIDCTLESSPIIRDCVISYNKAAALGGGIACRGLSCPLILRCTFIENESRGYEEGSSGGGLCCFVLSDAVVKNCVFIGNESQYGGGIDCSISFPTITNCLFVDNVADLGGGAISFGASDPIVTNCTMVNNSAYFGGAVALVGYVLPSYPVLTNCVLWDNYPNEVQVNIGSPTITFSNIEGGWTGSGNIDTHPLFVDSDSGDYHLTYPCPCRNGGSNGAPGLPKNDFEGDPRSAYGTADMGYDEFHTHLYVTGNPKPGGFVSGKLVGVPDYSPLWLSLGSGVLDPPLPTQYGEFHLDFPLILIGPLGAMPPQGFLNLPGQLPFSPSAPYDIPMQALIGNQLTNLCVLEVR